MTKWSPKHPSWHTGCWDPLIVAAEERDLRVLVDRLCPNWRTAKILDAGAAAGESGRRIFAGATQLVQCDLYGTGSVIQGDVRALPFPDATFDLVLAKRVLSNLEPGQERRQAAQELLRVAKRGAGVIIADVALRARQAASRARELLGLPPLPPIHAGAGALAPRRDLPPGPKPMKPLAAREYIWTRVEGPKCNDNKDFQLGDELREPPWWYRTGAIAAQRANEAWVFAQRAAVHRAWVLRGAGGRGCADPGGEQESNES